MNLNHIEINIKNSAVIIVVFAFAAIGYGFTDTGNKHYFALLKNIELYIQAYKASNELYVDEVEPSKLMRAGIDSMLKTLDPYTNYFSEGQIEEYKLKQTEAGDIGVELFIRNQQIVISEVIQELPAQTKGLRPGDIIASINGQSTKGRNIDDVKRILQGQPGSEVSLQIIREGRTDPMNLTLERSKNLGKSVPYYGMLANGVGYINLKTFLKPGCSGEVRDALNSLKKQGELEGLVFDLRQNGGGLLAEAIAMVNLFVPNGELVVKTIGKTDEWIKDYKTQQDAEDPKIPIVVLVDNKSASASEIVAGALQDFDRAVILGNRSFGKGLVQQTKDIGYNSKLKLTVAKYYLPSGRCVQALDYSGRYKDGTTAMPDSLRKAFKTRNSRQVYDGSGVEPDVPMPPLEHPPVIQALIKNNLIFDYANAYNRTHDSIPPAHNFQFTDKDYEDFLTFISGKDYTYQSKSEDDIEKLRTSAKEEQYYSAISETLQGIESKIKTHKNTELNKYKNEIKQLLRQEIASRYYYQTGKIETSLDYDENIKKAISLIQNNAEYSKYLK
ncbi:MAG: PDZ domain-containing protein [Sphingobacteriales bacterium]|nr:PDZ domain-containing protein [Sphingobacteriales bacterium]